LTQKILLLINLGGVTTPVTPPLHTGLGMGRGVPPQPTKGSGGASWDPAEPRPKTDFDVFWRPQDAHFCTYMTKSEGGGQCALAFP